MIHSGLESNVRTDVLGGARGEGVLTPVCLCTSLTRVVYVRTLRRSLEGSSLGQWRRNSPSTDPERIRTPCGDGFPDTDRDLSSANFDVTENSISSQIELRNYDVEFWERGGRWRSRHTPLSFTRREVRGKSRGPFPLSPFVECRGSSISKLWMVHRQR